MSSSEEESPVASGQSGRGDPRKLYVILEQASLETVKIGGKEFQLLNPDRHRDRIRKMNRDPATVRPDILHQCLLMLQDSPLNRAGLMQVYVRSNKNTLIEVNPKTRIPRTFDRFAGLMVQLLHKLSIHAAEGNHEKLLKVVKNPVTRYLPAGCPRIATSVHAEEKIHPRDLVPKKPGPVAIVIGAMSHGSVEPDFTERSVSLSSYPLSGALTCVKVCSAFEDAWHVESDV